MDIDLNINDQEEKKQSSKIKSEKLSSDGKKIMQGTSEKENINRTAKDGTMYHSYSSQQAAEDSIDDSNNDDDLTHGDEDDDKNEASDDLVGGEEDSEEDDDSINDSKTDDENSEENTDLINHSKSDEENNDSTDIPVEEVNNAVEEKPSTEEEIQENSAATQLQSTEKPQEIQPEEEVDFNNLTPNVLYEKNGYYFRTDDLGRPTSVYGKLDLKKGTRSEVQTDVGHKGIEGDDGGHLIGNRFNGPSDAFNLVPQNSNVNRGAWNTMEKDWGSAIKSGYDVIVQVDPKYAEGNTSPRPDFFIVKYYYVDKKTGEVKPNSALLFFNQSNKE